MCAVLGWVGTKSQGNSTFSTGFGWVGTTGYDVHGYDLDGNGKRSFARVRFGWVRKLRFITGPVPFPIPVEIPREKYRGNIPERSLKIFIVFILQFLKGPNRSEPRKTFTLVALLTGPQAGETCLIASLYADAVYQAFY